MEEVLGFCALVMTMLGIGGITVWFFCSILESVMKTRRRLKSSKYSALWRENERLKCFLAEVEEENAYLRETCYSERIPLKTNVG